MRANFLLHLLLSQLEGGGVRRISEFSPINRLETFAKNRKTFLLEYHGMYFATNRLGPDIMSTECSVFNSQTHGVENVFASIKVPIYFMYSPRKNLERTTCSDGSVMTTSKKERC
jgi:hypothetical protein